eukprot:CAMPEP_0194266848 /NCGR_PEP_ID=MMETSP0169-20130528/1611_1 /TAXON_ID=218684 /ORGANISM="Corethron pennatum, Strain L29A3" /LENGTH=735 /DNA_ID=CAMNT_0039007623 /DNA_START=185 /DNA_END=2392 /DNA_ORIENTATION=-
MPAGPGWKLLLVLFTLLISFTVQGAYREEFGARDRFWKHQVQAKTLIFEGVEHYQNIDRCLLENKREKTENKEKEYAQRKIVNRIVDSLTGGVLLVEIENAIRPEHAKSVQTLAFCIRKYIPSLTTSRSLFTEFNFEEDRNDDFTGEETLGGNVPTFMAPVISIFLPEVVKEMQEILEMAYVAAGWVANTIKDDILNTIPSEAIPAPKDVGIRTSEHLTYKNFPSLGSHDDGATSFTVNFALAGPEEYEGGDFFIIDNDSNTYNMKPNKYSCLVFLGGKYFHGVTTNSGNREMFSTEYWAYPDTPFGITLNNAEPRYMEDFIKACNGSGETPCKAKFLPENEEDLKEDIKYDDGDFDNEDEDDDEYNYDDGDFDNEDADESHYDDGDGDYYNGGAERFQQTPLKQGQMHPIRWGSDRQMVSDHALRIGLPVELRKELRKFMEDYGILDAARHHLFSESLEAHSVTFRELEHKKKEQSNLFQIHRPGMYDMSDNIWFDPGNEETHEEELAALGRGNFDLVLDAIGNYFGFKNLTVYGIGIFALSQCSVGAPLHTDGDGTGLINVLVAIELVEGADPEFVISDEEGRFGEFKYEYDVGLVIGGDVLHGTIAHDYRESQSMRLVASIYIAEVTDENVHSIMAENSSMFPLEGDIDWMNAQRGRHWGNGNTLANDKGRAYFDYDDGDYDLCERAAMGGWCTISKYAKDMLWNCPRSCNVYDPKFNSPEIVQHSLQAHDR